VTFLTPRGRSQERGNTPYRDHPLDPSRDNQDRGRSTSRERTGIQKKPQNIKLIEGQFAYFCNPCVSDLLAHKECEKYQKRQAENL
jgi:hypothetical protein